MSTDDTPAETPKEARPPRDPRLWESRSSEKYWRTHGMAFRPDPAFFDAAEPVVRERRTVMGYDKLYALWQAVRNTAKVPGAAAEIGTYRGGSAYFIASAYVALTGGEVPMHAFDTFEGHPAAAISEHDTFHTAGHFGGIKYKKVANYLSVFKQLQLHAGDVSASLSALPESAYRMVHIDTNLYKPTLDCLDYFGPRMSPGGVVVIDDYSSKNCPGVPKAAVEYLERTAVRFHVWDLRTEQLILIRC